MTQRIKLVDESVSWYVPVVLTLEAAQGLLLPYQTPIFVEPVRTAVDSWHEFVTESPDKALAMDATARANMIHCWWKQSIRGQLEMQDGIREIESLQFFSVAVGITPVVRFKLLNLGRSSNVSTIQQKLLEKQQYKEEVADALALEGVPNPPTILTCGYTIDDLVDLRQIEIRCEHSGSIEWRWVIWSQEEDGFGTFEQLPFPDFPQPRPAIVRSASNRDAAAEGEPGAGESQGSP